MSRSFIFGFTRVPGISDIPATGRNALRDSFPLRGVTAMPAKKGKKGPKKKSTPATPKKK